MGIGISSLIIDQGDEPENTFEIYPDRRGPPLYRGPSMSGYHGESARYTQFTGIPTYLAPESTHYLWLGNGAFDNGKMFNGNVGLQGEAGFSCWWMGNRVFDHARMHNGNADDMRFFDA